ncbi:MFS transporter [Streptomyces sp900105245]|uniref:MFS transporter n=1 Tax=Streptomyces sp. 900105245 TaxID=3154379 RepID=A0ABV1UMQ0_9ACTN
MHVGSIDKFQLPRQAWVILGGELVNAIGSGATIPFMLVYLMDVCHLPASSAAALMIIRAFLGFTGAITAGPLIDRLGPKAVATASLIFAGIGSLALCLTSNPIIGISAATACTISAIVCQPALDFLLSVIVPGSRRQTAFAWRQTFMNSGGAAGAALAAVLVGVWSATSGLKLIFLVDAASYISYAAILAILATKIRLPNHTSIPEAGEGGTHEKGSYRLVFRDSPMRFVCITLAVVTAAGFAQLEVSLPALLTQRSGSVTALGWMMSANMVTILLLQLPVQRLLMGRRRSTALFSALIFFSLSWTIILIAGVSSSALIIVGAAFGVAETLFNPVIFTLVNDLSPHHMRGRYNSAQLSCWTGGWMVGAMIATIFFSLIPANGEVLFALCAAALVSGMPLIALLRRSLPAKLTHIPLPSGKLEQVDA